MSKGEESRGAVMGEAANPRACIIMRYSEWTVLSACRQGPVHIRNGNLLYDLLRRLDFDFLLCGCDRPVTNDDFLQWHRNATDMIQRSSVSELSAGWAAKMINIYLKTASYVGDLGRTNLRNCIHPPIDAGLRRALRCLLRNQHPTIRLDLPATQLCQLDRTIWGTGTIDGIQTYDQYLEIIQALRLVAEAITLAAGVNCSLFEVEQLWTPD